MAAHRDSSNENPVSASLLVEIGAPFSLRSRVSLPGGVRARVLLPRWGGVVTAVRADGAEEAASEIEGGDAVVAGVLFRLISS